MKISGVIYLYDISQSQFTTSRSSFEIFKKLCGEDATKDVILVTTKWSDAKENTAINREKELADVHWKHLLDSGSKMCRFLGTPQSSWDVVNLILGNTVNTGALRIQEELVDMDTILEKTEAGRTLNYTLKQTLEFQKNLKERMKKEGGKGSSDLMERLRENERKVRSTLHQIKALDMPLSGRFKAIFGFVSVFYPVSMPHAQPGVPCRLYVVPGMGVRK